MLLGIQGTKDIPLILQRRTKDEWEDVMRGTGSEVFQQQFKGLRGNLKNALKNTNGKYRVVVESTRTSPYQDI